MSNKTKVIFRYWRISRDVIAIFPEIIADNLSYHCQSYESIGQHGACNPLRVIENSRPATEKESEPLLQELTKIGYDLEIVKHLRKEYRDTRKAEIKETYGVLQRL